MAGMPSAASGQSKENDFWVYAMFAILCAAQHTPQDALRQVIHSGTCFGRSMAFVRSPSCCLAGTTLFGRTPFSSPATCLPWLRAT